MSVGEETRQKRKTGVVVCRPVVVGSIAFFLGKQAVDEHSHKWTIFLRGLDCEDMSHFIDKVVFTLHPSCSEPVVVVDRPPYQVTQTGWGEFQALIRVHFIDPNEKPVDFIHLLRLYPDGGPTTNAALLRKPVVHELYDEFVFNEPRQGFYEILMDKTRHRRLPPDELTPYYTKFSEVDAMKKIIAAQNYVSREIERTCVELGAVENDIDFFSRESKKNKRANPSQGAELGPQAKRVKTEPDQAEKTVQARAKGTVVAISTADPEPQLSTSAEPQTKPEQEAEPKNATSPAPPPAK